MKETEIKNIAYILNAPEGSSVHCAVKVKQKHPYCETILYVKDATCLTLVVKIPDDLVESTKDLFLPGACLLLTGPVSRNIEKLILTNAVPLEDEDQLQALESVSIKRRIYDFDPTEYHLCNSRTFLREYEEHCIHPDDIFGQTVASLFGKKIATDSFFATLLNNALSYVDWVHHEKKLLREFWEPGTKRLFEALDACFINDALGAYAGVAREIEDALRSEGWVYYNSPGYGIDAEDVACSTCEESQTVMVSGRAFSGISKVPVFQDFEKAVVKVFGERIANDREYVVHVWNALSETTWQDAGDRVITYRSEAADLLVEWLAGGSGNFQFTAEDCCYGGDVLPEIEKAMEEQGWKWLNETGILGDDEAYSHFFGDLEDLFGSRMPRDKQLCEDIWATITSAAWYNAHGESLSHLGGRGDGYTMAVLRRKGSYLDWYCSEGGGVRQDIVDALKCRGWHMWEYRTLFSFLHDNCNNIDD